MVNYRPMSLHKMKSENYRRDLPLPLLLLCVSI
jgi:hypothetical protein